MFEVELLTLLNNENMNAISFGDNTPKPPYVVVRPEPDALARGTVFRIFSHRAKGQQYYLNEDIEKIIDTLEDSEFKYNSEDYNPLVVVNKDDTLSREVTFLIVSKY